MQPATTCNMDTNTNDNNILMSWVRHKTARGCGVSTWDNEVALCHNYLRVTLEQGVVPINSPRGHEVPSWRPAGDSLSHG